MFRKTSSSRPKKPKNNYDKSSKANIIDNFLVRDKSSKFNKQEPISFKQSGSVKIGYTKTSRTFYLNNREVFDSVYRLCLFKDKGPKSVHLILKNKSVVDITKLSSNINDVVSKGLSHNNSFVVKIDDKVSVNKYFVKEVEAGNNYAYTAGREGIRESVAQNIISELGFNTVPVHFCFCNTKHKRSFIVYDYSKFNNLADVLHRNNGKLKVKDHIFTAQDFENLCTNAQKEINSKLNSFKDKYPVPKSSTILDIRPENIFIDKKKGKLYIFDPWLNSDPRYSIK